MRISFNSDDLIPSLLFDVIVHARIRATDID